MPSFTLGLDLGQANDYSALAVVEHLFHLPPEVAGRRYVSESNSHLAGSRRAFHVRALRRWERGTPYPAVAADVAEVMTSEVLRFDAQLLYDATGVGRAVGDLLFEAWRAGRAGNRAPWPVTFTIDSKEQMVNNTLIPLQQGTLRFAPGVPLMEELIGELSRFQQNITASGRTTFDVARDKDGHGDLATALMIALSQGEWIATGSPRYVDPPEAAAPRGGGDA